MSQIKDKFIDWRDVFRIDRVLKSRGFEVTNVGTLSSTLLSHENWSNSEKQLLFDVMNSDKLRSQLLFFIEGKAGFEIDPLVEQLIKNANFRKDRQRFSTSFEWYLGELFVKHFGAFSGAFGVEVSNIFRNSTGTKAGDFDVLAVLADLSLLYIEAKTEEFQRKKVEKALERSMALHTSAVVMLTSEQFDPIKFKPALKDLEHPIWGKTQSFDKIKIKGEPDSEIFLWCNQIYFVSANERHGKLEPKLRMVLRDIGFKRSIHGFSSEIAKDYSAAGYEYEEILFEAPKP